jgi:BMFP domain-containing protein YqiC
MAIQARSEQEALTERLARLEAELTARRGASEPSL